MKFDELIRYIEKKDNQVYSEENTFYYDNKCRYCGTELPEGENRCACCHAERTIITVDGIEHYCWREEGEPPIDIEKEKKEIKKNHAFYGMYKFREKLDWQIKIVYLGTAMLFIMVLVYLLMYWIGGPRFIASVFTTIFISILFSFLFGNHKYQEEGMPIEDDEPIILNPLTTSIKLLVLFLLSLTFYNYFGPMFGI